MTKKRTTNFYTKKDLEVARKAGDHKLFGGLAIKMLQGDKLKIAEAETAASVLKATKLEGSICFLDLAPIPAAQDARFIELYISYADDLDGKYGIDKFNRDEFQRTGLISRSASREEKEEDVIRLTEYYHDWKKYFDATKRPSDQVLDLIIIEIKKDLTDFNRKLTEGSITKKDHDYEAKSAILYSKFLYLRVKRVMEDTKGSHIIIDFRGTSIEITAWSMVHILNRHYAGKIKTYKNEKSFHADEELRFFEDPQCLKQLVEKISAHPDSATCNYNSLYFKFNGVIYVIHAEVQKKDSGERYERLQSFYPLEEKTNLKNLEDNYHEFAIEPNLSGYKPK